jgi:hypothetical protein
MGGKVNLYLDDESLDLWYSIPSGHRSQIVRDALKSAGLPDKNREEILLIQQKKRRIKEIPRELEKRANEYARLSGEIEELESNLGTDTLQITSNKVNGRNPDLEKEFRDLVVRKGKEEAQSFAAKFSSGNYHEMKVNVGKGLWMTYAQRLNFAKIELYIYRGPGHKMINQSHWLFDIFNDHRSRVEECFGEELDWFDGHTDKDGWSEVRPAACRIGKKYKDFDLHNRECWDSIASEMVSDMNRLNSALRPIFRKLRGKTPYEYRRILRYDGVYVRDYEWEDWK